MKLEKMAIANASALSSTLLWIFCSLGVVLMPGFVESIRSAMMHGSTTEALSITFGSFLMGGVTIIIISWIWGYLFGWAWEYVSKK